MVTLTLEEKDRDLLRRVLEYYLSELRMEVAGTDRQEFRDKLKDEEETLKIILSRLG
jgi:hypothetical protein